MPGDEMRDRFDESDGLIPDEPDSKCGDCDEWHRCTVRGHESVGWCSKWEEFMEEGDDVCEQD